MQEYYFLFALALIWTFFATIQDLKTREVANWLNFSFIVFALAYRAFYSVLTKNAQFFVLGFLGFLIFVALAYAFYYSKTFAGGDAKLLMGFGIILPYQNYLSLFSLTISAVFLLFLIGAVYSLLYSAIIVAKNRNKFSKELTTLFKKQKLLITISAILLIFSIIASFSYPFALFFSLLFIIPFIYLYSLSLDKCLIVLLPPKKLTEGDWLEKSVKINSKLIIKKTVHGLSQKDIQILRRYKKSVLIKQGIPFVPAFLITLILMGSFWATSAQVLPNFLSFLP